eukprot:PhM_4_TR8444/c0_g2_i4/m.51343
MVKKRVRDEDTQSVVGTEDDARAQVPCSIPPARAVVDTDGDDNAASSTTPELAQQQQLADRLFEKHGENNKITDDEICDTLFENSINMTIREFKTLCADLRSGDVAGVTETLKSTCLFPKAIAGLVTDMSSPEYWEKTLKPQGDDTKQEQFIQDAFQRKGYKVKAGNVLSTIKGMNDRGESLRFMRQLDLLRTVCEHLEQHVLFDQLIGRLRDQCKRFYGQHVFFGEGNEATLQKRDPLGGQQLPCLSFEVPSTEVTTNQTLVFVGESGCGKTVAMISFPAFLGEELKIDSTTTTFVAYDFSYLSDYTPLPKRDDEETTEWKARRNDHVLGHIANHLANKILKNDTTNALEDLLTAATQKPVCLVIAVDEIGRLSHADVAHALCSEKASGRLKSLLLEY